MKMSLITQSETALKEKILSFDSYYEGCAGKGRSQKYIMSGSGCRDLAQLLPPAIYRATVCSILFALEREQSIGNKKLI
jgi:hypothetical protein